MFLFSKRIGFSDLRSLILVAIFGLTTMAWPLSQTGVPVGWSTLFLLSGIYFLYTNKDKNEKKWFLFSGILISFSVVLRYEFALFVPFIILFMLMILKNQSKLSRLILFVIPMIICVIPIMLYNQLIWGSLLQSALQSWQMTVLAPTVEQVCVGAISDP